MAIPEKTTNLPFDLVYFVLRSNKIKPHILKSYLYLKFHYPDQFIMDQSFFKEWSGYMSCNVKTAKTHFEVLLKVNFIGLNTQTKRVFIRSKYITGGDISTTQNRLSVKVSKDHLKHFTPFLLSAVVTHRIKIFKATLLTRPDLTCDESLQGLVLRGKAYTEYAPLAITYLSEIMNRCPAWIERYKKQAIKLGYIKAKSDRIYSSSSWDAKNYIVPETMLGRTRNWKGKISLVATDLLSSNLQVVKRKKCV